MKTFKNLYIALIFIGLVGCTDDFSEINTNPNAPISVQPSLLFRQVIYDYGEQMSYEGFVAGNLLAQHFTMVDFNLFDRHDLSSPQLGGNPWPIIYRNLRDNELILDLASENAVYEVYEGPALIMKAYMTAALTDIYGDVPYFEALNGKEGNTTPAYDAQQDIYMDDNGILDNLNKAIASIQAYNGTQPLEGDILFQGDLNQWMAFANSLRIKYLMRISGQVDVSAELQAIANAGNYIQSNADNAAFDFTNSQPNTFRLAVLRAGDFNLFIESATMMEVIQDLNDPREEVFFRPSEANGTFDGLLNGPDASNTSISVADYSLTGTIFRENTGNLDANFMTAWETYFLLAEAAQRGLITQDAQSYYETGVQLAFDYWQTALPSDYLTTGNAAFGANSADPIEQIITQKWLANTINGYEGWIEYRRTGFPALKTVSASLNNDLIPIRMPYPADEAAFNAANYEAATVENNNSVNSRVWWDNN
ncbi:SusD/RagB family nutrient-binding outer membrane lipoprotein [Roseivirga sp.]|uniref:SusD/RagB family nutrient-binding outer membrane lipoprotein n=1 Tax=Roseivirga sp. TaxID=1964215 RepID=UPI003B51A214